jgi:hypothetical protein
VLCGVKGDDQIGGFLDTSVIFYNTGQLQNWSTYLNTVFREKIIYLTKMNDDQNGGIFFCIFITSVFL